MFSYSKGNSFEEILSRMLNNISNEIDKRQGSIIYDALAPAAAELAQCYIALDVYADQTYLLSATADNLDKRATDYGITRKPATKAERLITIYDTTNNLMEVEIGTRFSVPNEYGGYNFTITRNYEQGVYIAECETAGTIGNDYVGNLLPLNSINNLGRAFLGTVYTPGTNIEEDEELRADILLKINQEAFGGNKADYMQFTRQIEGVGDCKVFPVWDGGGTVKVAIITDDYTIPSNEFVSQVQEQIDPTSSQGQGQGLGLAPIGHTVTVVAPTKLDINIAATLELEDNYDVGNVQSLIETEIENYIKTIQDSWSEYDTLRIYISKITAAILNIQQVRNVTNVTINSSSEDLIITNTGTNVQFPMLNEVSLNES